MPFFKYVAKNIEGQTIIDKVEAQNKDSVVELLRSKNLLIVSIDEDRRVKKDRPQKIKSDDLVIFSRQLATMVESGIPLVQGLDILASQMENKNFQSVIARIRNDIESGSSLSGALAKHPHIFSLLYLNMIKAGETSGMLDEILDRLASYLEKINNLRRKISSAMVYPIVVTLMAIIITMVLILKVIPTFKDIFATLGGTLPWPTQMLIMISDVIRHYFLVLVALLVVIGVIVSRYIMTPRGRKQFDAISLKVPVFGILVQKVAIARFSRTLSTLVRSGVPILGALEIVAKTAGNKIVEEAVDSVRVGIREGENIAGPLSTCKVFPPMVTRMISVGEETGEIEKMLTKIADFYEEQVDVTVSSLTSLIEPIVIVFLGVVVGSIVIAMFLPIFKITELIGQ
ncbi:MAG: type II secretion system F family protein [Candidatus Omnitrophota bacterium]